MKLFCRGFVDFCKKKKTMILQIRLIENNCRPNKFGSRKTNALAEAFVNEVQNSRSTLVDDPIFTKLKLIHLEKHLKNPIFSLFSVYHLVQRPYSR